MDDASQSKEPEFFECKFCKERFHPVLMHDLHVLAKHPTQWGAAPCFPNSGVFSLATKDVWKVVHQEFASLRSITFDQVKASTESVSKSLFGAEIRKSISRLNQIGKSDDQSKPIESRKRRFDELLNDGEGSTSNRNDEKRAKSRSDERSEIDSGKSIGGSPPSDVPFDGRSSKRWSTSTSASSVADLPDIGTMPKVIPKSTSASLDDKASPEKTPAWKKPRNITTYVAKSLSICRRNRLALTGKPYYLPSHHRSGRDRREDRRESESTVRTSTERHAFRVFPQNYGDGATPGSIYLFQAANASDLLCNLTTKITKAARQKRAKSENTGGDKESTGARFARRRRADTPWGRDSDRYRDR